MLSRLKDDFWARSILAGLIATAIWTALSDIAPFLNAIFAAAPGFFLGAVAMAVLAFRSMPKHVKPWTRYPAWNRSRRRAKRLGSVISLSLDELYEALIVRSGAVYYSGLGIVCLVGLLPKTPEGSQPSFLDEVLVSAILVAALVILARITMVAVRLFFRASRVFLDTGPRARPARMSRA